MIDTLRIPLGGTLLSESKQLLGILLSHHQRFTYEPLSKREIRIIDLHPGNLCTTINCTLLNTHVEQETQQPQLTSKQGYGALSYTWGVATHTAPILCNGQILEVTQNLHEALLYLRHRGIRRLWIDAICIDQTNVLERAEQILLMNVIYQEANRLIVWLGASNGASDQAFHFLHRLGMSAVSLTRDWLKLQKYTALHEEDLTALYHLLQRPWFSRTWIIQEVVFAKTASTIIYCGKSASDWTVFTDAIDAMEQLGVLQRLPTGGGDYSNVTKLLPLFKIAQPGQLDLVDLVSMSRYAGATDPRDKLYALFNLARDREELKYGGDGSVMHLEIDYTQPVKKVYVNAAKAMIASTGIQDVLQQAHSKHKSIPDLPTWVPDWSVSKMENSVDELRRFPKIQRGDSFYFPNPTEYVLEGIREDFSASPSPFLRQDLYFGETETLRVSGVWFDEIKKVSKIFPSPEGEGSGLLGLMSKLLRWYGECQQLAAASSYDPLETSINDALWRTLTADQANDQRPAPLEFRQYFQSLWRFLRTSQRFFKSTNNVEATEEFILRYKTEALPFLSEMTRTCNNRRFALTHGKYMCLVPDEAEIDDVITLLDGCQVPFLLRQSRGKFRLIGDCYVHGIMYGEALNDRTWKTRSGKSHGQEPSHWHKRSSVFVLE